MNGAGRPGCLQSIVVAGRVRPFVVAAGVVLCLLASGCGPSTPTGAEITDGLVRSGYSRTEARCLAAAYRRILDDDQLRAVAERGGAGVPAEKATALSQAISTCAPADQAGESATTTTVPSTTVLPGIDASSSTASEGDGSSTSAPDSTTSVTGDAGSSTP